MLPYIRIARPDHWFKNIFVLPGAAVGLLIGTNSFGEVWLDVLLALFVASLAASANYTINELVDAETDKHHPTKRDRPIPQGRISPRLAVLQAVVLAAAAISIAITLGQQFAVTIAIFLLLGLIYNVRPLRAKDRVYLDVVVESANNAVRVTLGWAVVIPEAIPPASLVFAFWFGGAYLMAVKRYAEYRTLGDSEIARQYRRSFGNYTESTLLLSALFYAMNSAFFIGIFLIKYRIEFLLTFPLLALVFSWYFAIGMQPNSVAQTPELLYRHRTFLLYILLVIVCFSFLSVFDIPGLHFLLEPSFAWQALKF